MGSGRTEEKEVNKDRKIREQLTLICGLLAREQKREQISSKDHTLASCSLAGPDKTHF